MALCWFLAPFLTERLVVLFALGGCRELESEGEIITRTKKLLSVKTIFVAYLLKVH